MTEEKPTSTIADELKTLKAIASALTTLTESQARDDIFYVSLDLANRLDALSQRVNEAKPAHSERV